MTEEEAARLERALAEARDEIERLAVENRALSGEQDRLRLRRDELSNALQAKHEEFLEMLARVQEREESAVQRALQELTRSEERFRLVVDSVRDYAIFLLDELGMITSWNEGAAAILGYDPEEIVGEPFTRFLPEGEQSSARRLTFLAQAAEEGRAQAEGWRIRKDGSRIWVSETVTPIRDEAGEPTAFVNITRDLTERMEHETALEETAEELEATVTELEEQTQAAENAWEEAENAREQVAFLAEASRRLVEILDYEEGLRELARITVPELADWVAIDVVDLEEEDVGTSRRLVVLHANAEREDDASALETWGPPGDPLGVGRVLDRAEATVHRRLDWEELSRRARNGEEARLLERMGTRSAMVIPLVARGEVLGAMTLAVGDSRAEYDEDDLALARELAYRTATAADNARLYSAALVASRAKSDFLGVMSHELRTPLNAIVGYADILQAGVYEELAEDQREQVTRIETSARHLLHLIEGILSYTRLEAGKEQPEPEAVELGELTRDVATMLEAQARKAGLDLRVRAPEDGTVVETDPKMLRQILLNLLSNAVKFTDEGRVELRVEVDPEVQQIVLAVEDTGIGIEEDDLEKIFEPYWQGPQTAERAREGTGLGLNVTRELIDLMGGELRVESEPGRGTTVTVHLPLSSAPPAS